MCGGGWEDRHRCGLPAGAPHFFGPHKPQGWAIQEVLPQAGGRFRLWHFAFLTSGIRQEVGREFLGEGVPTREGTAEGARFSIRCPRAVTKRVAGSRAPGAVGRDRALPSPPRLLDPVLVM